MTDPAIHADAYPAGGRTQAARDVSLRTRSARDAAGLVETRSRLWIALVLIGAAALTFYRLGAGSLWDQDETKYAQVAREILKTGDPVTLHINGRPWYVHPPLYMWLVALTGRTVGFTEFSVRFWSAAASVLAVYATILLGRALFSPRAGILAGAILAVTLQFLFQSRLAVFDTVLLAWMLLAMYAFVRAFESGRRAEYLWFFLYAGLGTLTKGPIGLILPALTIVPFVTLRRAWHRWREVPWALGLLLYALVGLSWYAVETWLHGRAFVSLVLGYYGLGRFFGVVEDQAGSWYYYAPVVLLGAFPWTAFWPTAAAYHARRLKDDGSLLVLLWCGLTFVFFSAAGTKLPNYVLPIYPFAAVGVAALWDAALGDPRLTRGIAVSLGLLAGLMAALYLGVRGYLVGLYPDAYRTYAHILFIPAAALAAGVGVVLILAAVRWRLAAFAALCVTAAVSWLAVLTWVVPVVEAQKPMKPLGLTILSALRPGDRIVGYRMDIAASLIYYTDHNVEWVYTPGDLRRTVCAPGRVFLVITGKEWEAVVAALPGGFRPLAEREGTDVLVKPASVRCPPGG
jgi:4-amino-4-deoxy-L-arabinose transferase-like glycosyltransferase